MTDLDAAWQIAEQMRALGLSVIIASEPDGWEVEVSTTEALYQQGYSGVSFKGATVEEALEGAGDYVLSKQGAGSLHPPSRR